MHTRLHRGHILDSPHGKYIKATPGRISSISLTHLDTSWTIPRHALDERLSVHIGGKTLETSSRKYNLHFPLKGFYRMSIRIHIITDRPIAGMESFVASTIVDLSRTIDHIGDCRFLFCKNRFWRISAPSYPVGATKGYRPIRSPDTT